MESRRILVTGGAGYLGSHLCEALLEQGHDVRALDNLSTGRREHLAACMDHPAFAFVEADLLVDDLAPFLADRDAVFHLAANPDARAALRDTRVDMDQNLEATYRLLEAVRDSEAGEIVFTSTSTVYGESPVVPTPEGYGPPAPISLYGATKLGCEGLLSAYCYTFDLEAVVFRFANVVGGRATHGVVPDFVEKLREDPARLEILGREPGTRKSYTYLEDCLDGMVVGWRAASQRFEVYNLGSEDQITVRHVADVVCDAMDLSGVAYEWTGGVDEGRGWRGDVRDMWLDVSKLKATGWTPVYTSAEAVYRAVGDLLAASEA